MRKVKKIVAFVSDLYNSGVSLVSKVSCSVYLSQLRSSKTHTAAPIGMFWQAKTPFPPSSLKREVVLTDNSTPNTKNNENKQVHLRKDLLAATFIFSIARKTLQICKSCTSYRIKSLQAYMLCLSLLYQLTPFAYVSGTCIVYHLAVA